MPLAVCLPCGQCWQQCMVWQLRTGWSLFNLAFFFSHKGDQTVRKSQICPQRKHSTPGRACQQRWPLSPPQALGGGRKKGGEGAEPVLTVPVGQKTAQMVAVVSCGLGSEPRCGPACPMGLPELDASSQHVSTGDTRMGGRARHPPMYITA